MAGEGEVDKPRLGAEGRPAEQYRLIGQAPVRAYHRLALLGGRDGRLQSGKLWIVRSLTHQCAVDGGDPQDVRIEGDGEVCAVEIGGKMGGLVVDADED